MLHPSFRLPLLKFSGLIGSSCLLMLMPQATMASPFPLSIAQSAPADSETTAQAETSQPALAAPTVRYARGEDVGLAEIVQEWRGYYTDVPVYLCICQNGSCNQTEQWPYRVFDRFQMSVALGPNNGLVSEAAGSNCFDIADGSRPAEPRAFTTQETPAAQAINRPSTSSASSAVSRPNPAPSTPAASQPVTAPVQPTAATAQPASPTPASVAAAPSASGIPTATVINEGADIRLDWPSGRSNIVNVADSTWNLTVLDALDCGSLSQVDQKILEAKRVISTPAVDETTGNIAVPVLLDSCVETDQSAVFILDPTEGGGYALYRTQLPDVGAASQSENRAFSNEFSSYPFSSINGLQYWNGSLLVRHSSASGAEAVMIFRPDQTPSGTYAGCGVLTANEGAATLCDE